MKIKKGDKVKVIAGADKGTIAEVKATLPKTNKVIVEGVNVAKKHLKPSNANPDGGIVDKEMPIDASNVMVYDAKAKAASKIGFKVDAKGNKTRVYKKSGAEIKGGKK